MKGGSVVEKTMSLSSRRELLSTTAERYRWATKKGKGLILDEFLASTEYSRKHAIVLLNRPVANKKNGESPRRRHYDYQVQLALARLWKAANRICTKRLVPFLPELISSLERHGHLALPRSVRGKLLSISPATADRLLASERRGSHRGVSTTKPGGLLKKQIRVRTFADWDDLQPGFFEADLVAHCGEATEGSFLHTLVLVDVATSWTECVALLRRSEADVIGALNAVRKRLPYPLLGLDTDNGSEFINYEMLRYCQKEEITFTRSRAYRRNDQAFVEEKNGSVVRRLIGYDRYEGLQAWRKLMQLYEVLRLYQNFFQPSMKLVSKTRTGSRVTKKYDRAQCPVQRVLGSGQIDEEQQRRLTRLWQRSDPVALLEKLEVLQNEFWMYAYQKPHEEIASASAEIVRLPGGNEELETGDRIVPRRYRRIPKPRAPRTWRTREDPFAEVWKEVRLRLEVNPAQTAKALFQDLQVRYPGRFHDGQLRTLQRRVREWRRQHMYQDANVVGL